MNKSWPGRLYQKVYILFNFSEWSWYINFIWVLNYEPLNGTDFGEAETMLINPQLLIKYEDTWDEKLNLGKRQWCKYILSLSYNVEESILNLTGVVRRVRAQFYYYGWIYMYTYIYNPSSHLMSRVVAWPRHLIPYVSGTIPVHLDPQYIYWLEGTRYKEWNRADSFNPYCSTILFLRSDRSLRLSYILLDDKGKELKS